MFFKLVNFQWDLVLSLKNKRIMYVITRSDIIGGATIHLKELVQHALLLEMDVFVVVGGGGKVVDYFSSLGCKVYSLGSMHRKINLFKDLVSFFELKRLVMEVQPNIIHLHSAKAGIIGRLVSKYLGIKSVYTVHGWPFTNGISGVKKHIFLKIEKFMMNFTDEIITVSKYDKMLAETYGFKFPHKISPIQNGMPEVVSNKVDLTKMEDDRGIVKFIMVARFDAQKNQKKLIEAFSKVRNENWELEFLGDGENINECKFLVNNKGLSNKVIFSGFVTDVDTKLKFCDVFVLISNWEGLPLTIIEAMSNQMPVIASNVGGVPELIEQDKSGFIVDDVESIVLAIESYLFDLSLIKSHGVSGYKKYKNNFSLNIMLDKTFNLYESRVLK